MNVAKTAASQTSKRFFSQGGRPVRPITFVEVDWILKGRKHVMEYPIDKVPTIYSLKEKVLDERGLNFEAPVDIRRTLEDDPMEITEDTPECSKEKPLLVSVGLTQEQEEMIRKQDEMIRKKEEIRMQGVAFVEALMSSEPTPIPFSSDEFDFEDPGLKVLKGIPFPFRKPTTTVLDIVLRKDTEPFWKSVLSAAGSRSPVAAVGHPGIGKSSTFPVAIKMALEEGHPVTYLHRTPDGTGHYFQFVPANDGSYHVNTFPESTPLSELPTMNDPEAYLFVDPGQTKDSCDWSRTINAKLVINASPDERHWGESSFIKSDMLLGHRGGVFRYYSQYTLHELLVARETIDSRVTADEVCERFTRFGGNARHVFGLYQKSNEDGLASSLEQLSEEQAERIGLGKIDLDGSRKDSPKSFVLGQFASADFFSRSYGPQSQFVADKLIDMVCVGKWAKVKCSPSSTAADVMEEFTALMMLRKDWCFKVRRCVGKSHNLRNEVEERVLGGCPKIVRAANIAGKVRSANFDNGVVSDLFVSETQNHELYDMIYREGENTFHAINATQSKSAKQVGRIDTYIDNAIEQLGLAEGQTLNLYYATDAFDDFVTSPADLEHRELNGVFVNLFHLDADPEKQP